MKRFVVEGGHPLKGSVVVSGAKNAVIKMIAASLLTSEEVILSNVPKISDVETILAMVRSFGTEAVWVDNNKLKLRSAQPEAEYLHSEITKTTRSGVMLMAPLLARYGKFSICAPGGDAIGIRPINRHIEVLRSFGAEIVTEGQCFIGEAKMGLKGGDVGFSKNTVMGTEQAILAAVLATGKTLIRNAAAEPEIDDLIVLLSKMGAKVVRKEERLIEIEGVSLLHGASHEVIPDHNEAATFIIAAAVTRGDVIVSKIIPSHLLSLLAKLEKVGVTFESGKDQIRVWVEKGKDFSPIDIETGPYPGFKTDWQQPFCVLLTQCHGLSRVNETIYLNRFEYIKELNRMGAKIENLKPSQRGLKAKIDEEYDIEKQGEPETLVEITGPTQLIARRLSIPDLRAGATLVIAALGAKGSSEIFGVEQIDRGYEDFDGKLKKLGAKIERFE